MKRYFLVSIILLSIFYTSCIPYKDTLYLQNKSTATDSLQVIVEQQKPYRVQINDILNVRIKVTDQDNVQIFNPIGIGNLNASGSERAYFDGFTVDLHGNIRIPELGEMNVLGYTTTEIEKLITDKLLEDQFKETANIFVTVKLTGLRYTTYGEIGKGMQTIYQERVNIFEAIANAGDITDTGDKTDVLIVRQYPQGQKIHHIDLTDLNVMNSPYYYVQPNDMIYVKPVKQKSWGTGTNALQNISSIATILSLVTTSILLFQRI
ncbi:polysaccharide biosynthesis/export family protein [Seonamhaeicola maritimus]|uniref:Sugar transporter n=1 Tax=Seonamhaeicola maritimus TaxID=2591822 RepID=A0A5C7GK77_9FLAO|nr:polysaccharide biosynthesis/export family protein [Seonamhaeicola maritimus]TXG38849.1 sugar transporter [Seonamhaeicola maritimus]